VELEQYFLILWLRYGDAGTAGAALLTDVTFEVVARSVNRAQLPDY
jgi:hypothetical protein